MKGTILDLGIIRAEDGKRYVFEVEDIKNLNSNIYHIMSQGINKEYIFEKEQDTGACGLTGRPANTHPARPPGESTHLFRRDLV